MIGQERGKRMKKTFKKMILFSGFLYAGLYGRPQDSMKAYLPKEWYPSNPGLPSKLQELDQEAAQTYPASVKEIRAIIAPHAALMYSGVVAAGCFRLLDPKKVRRVILLAPSHSLPFRGIILPPYSSYRLPHGVLPVEATLIHDLKQKSELFMMLSSKEDPHYKDHSIEMQLLFIQKYVPKAKIVPLIVGSFNDSASLKIVASILKKYIDEQTIVVVSSDFTHYGPRFNNVPFQNDEYTSAKIRLLDNTVLQALFKSSLPTFFEALTHSEANICGKNPLALLIALFQEGAFPGAVPHLIGYETSGSKGKDTENSVSYVGIVFGKQGTSLTGYEKKSFDTLIAHDDFDMLSMPLMSPNMEHAYKDWIQQKSSY